MSLLLISIDKTSGWHCCICDVKLTNDVKSIKIDSNNRTVFMCRICTKQLARFLDLIKTDLLSL